MVNLFYFYKLHILYLYIIVNLTLQIDVIVLCYSIGKKAKDPHSPHYCYFLYFFSEICLRSVIYNICILFNNILKFELLI